MNTLTQFELNILDWISNIHNPILDTIMPIITLLGDHGIPSIILAAILLVMKKTRKEGVALSFALICTLVTCNLTLKPLIGRMRPYDIIDGINLLVPALSDFSFPSGHTTVAFATAAILAYHHKSYAWLFWILASLIGFSRLYLYVHFPSDVIFGVILGIACGYIGIILRKTIYKKINAKKIDTNTKS